MLRIETRLIRRSLAGDEADCGDAGLVRISGAYCLLALVDALGHGPEAADVANHAIRFMESHDTLAPCEMLTGMHEALKGTRGAVASVCRLDLETGALAYAGIGNIAAKIFGPRYLSFVNMEGVIGYSMRRSKQFTAELTAGHVLALCSDGVRSGFDPAELNDILRDSADFIAAQIMSRFGKTDDDASCLVARPLP
ncbi:serine/threonine-protein phosphatase [bacterium]|nr:serine/threonine-protein phosphatase [bacterium]